jgi:large subunit ribosomal protein L12
MVDYVYAALLLNSAGKPVDEAGITKIVEASGVAPDEVRIKALVAALEGVDITKVLSQAAAMPVAVAAAPAGAAAAAAAAPAEAKEEKKEQEEEAGIEGLGALFG